MPLQTADFLIAKDGQQRFFIVLKIEPSAATGLSYVTVVHQRRDGVARGRNRVLAYRDGEEAPIGYYRALRRYEVVLDMDKPQVKLVKGIWALENKKKGA